MHPNDHHEEDPVRLRLVVPPALKKEALYLSHDSTLGGHYGIRKSLHRSRQMFYWPNQCTDVQKHVSCCQTCQKRNFHGITKAQIRQLPVVSYPLQRVGIDLVGKLSPSHSGNCYILTIVCHFSRFVQAYPLPNKKTETIAQAFLDYVCRYGCPEHVVSDRGSEFNSAVFKAVLSQLNSKLHLTTAFHPQSNGMTEAFNKLLKNTLHAMVQCDMMSWDEQLPCAVLALNCSYHPAIKNTPYFLFHGRDPPLQYSVLLAKNVLNYGLDADSSTSVFTRLQKAFKEAQQASQQAHDLNKKYRCSKEKKYCPGDAVFLRNDSKACAKYSKFRNKWIGPFRITKTITDVNYEIIPIYGNGKKQIVHVDRLKIANMGESVPYIELPENENVTSKTEQRDEVEIDPISESSDEEDIVICQRRRQLESEPINRYALRSRGPVPEFTLPERRRTKVPAIAVTVLALIMIFFFC